MLVLLCDYVMYFFVEVVGRVFVSCFKLLIWNVYVIRYYRVVFSYLVFLVLRGILVLMECF